MPVFAHVDGASVTDKVIEGSVSHALNGRSTATIKMPLSVASGGINSSLYIDTGAAGNFWGRVHHVDEQGDENEMYRLLTAVDPGFILEFRPARDGAASPTPGNFATPTFMTRDMTGPAMLQETLSASESNEGSLGFSLGSFASGGVNLSGLPTDFPMTISEIVGLLTGTGEVDVVMSFSAGGATMNVYNGDFGTDLSGSVSFKYAMGTASNCRACRRTIDASALVNKYWLFMAPRYDREHWRGNITGDHPELPALPGYATVAGAISSSRSTYLQRMVVEAIDADYVTAHQLYLHYWLRYSYMRANPKTMVHLTPDPGIAPSFSVGDRIHVQAGSSFGGGFSGTQRVFQYTYRWDENGVIELGEPVGQAAAPALLVSADQEALA
jgi:hypothetical protein